VARGEHIWVTRPLGYTHHGIDCGDDTVIHFTGEPGKKSDAAVARTSMADFALDSIVHVREYSHKDNPLAVVSRAESKLGSTEYNLVTNNCEHFATWCCTAKTASQQVRMVSSLTTSGAAAATSLGATAGVVSAVGSVAGVSGAGVMSGLATAGSLVGGGAAMGPLVLALGPAALSIGAVQLGLRGDKTLPKVENRARRDGRVASVAGAAAASAGGMAAIAAAGTTGLSAVGITSGLAAIGTAVGGGMVAGTVAVAAAPAVVAGAVGMGAYIASRKLRGIRPKKWAPPPAGTIESADPQQPSR
jgi:Lecithin retinol acyltransferase